MKVVINKCYGAFILSQQAINRYIELAGLKLYSQRNKYGEGTYYYINDDQSWWDDSSIKRTDSYLIQVIEELKELANGSCRTNLKIVEIPDNVQFKIIEYNGLEHIK